ncbi:NACHT domain-containing protein, partial [Streptomyces ipomoeae]|uniref:NACHT domain-containing protein n=1 Tax=Streptomyces ipomoeae TaxID=103232 RepID=UPI0029B9B3B5
AGWAVVRRFETYVLWGAGSQWHLDRAADLLVQELDVRWQQEEGLHRVAVAGALPVRWTNAPARLAAPWRDVRATSDGADERIDLRGQFTEFHDMFRHLPSGRLVVLGPAGAGKSVLVLRFALDYLARRSPRDPVPLILPLASWRPETHPQLWDWAVARLAAEHPAIARGAGAASAKATARELLRTGRILPVLDGFDELPPDVRTEALRTLNETLGHRTRVVLTSRMDEYADAVASGAGVLSAAAAIWLRPLRLEDAAAYLPRHAIDDSWEAVFDEIRSHPDDLQLRALAEVLSRPLMLSLAKATYGAEAKDPAVLLDRDRLPDRAAIEHHLLTAFVPSLYTAPSPQSIDGSTRRWDAESAELHLRFLARHAAALGGGEVRWWQLTEAVPWPVRAIGPALALCVAGSLLADFRFTSSISAYYAIDVPLVVIGLLLCVFPLLAAGLDSDCPPRRARFGGRLVPALKRAGIAFLVLMFPMLGPELPLLPLVVVCCAAAASAFVDVPAAHDVASGPRALLRSDRRLTLCVGVVHAFGGGSRRWAVALVLLTPLDLWALRYQVNPESGPDWALLITGTIAAFFLCGVSMSAWGQFTVARLWLAARHQLPWRVMGFLDDAHRRGVLRQIGGAYAFRHSRVQDTLRGGDTDSDGEGSMSARGALLRRAEGQTTGAAFLGGIGVTVFWLAFIPLNVAASSPGDERYLSVPHPCDAADRGTVERTLSGEVRLAYRTESSPQSLAVRDSETCAWSSTADFGELVYEVSRYEADMQQSALRHAHEDFVAQVDAWTSKDTDAVVHAPLAQSADESALYREKAGSSYPPRYTVLARSANLMVSLQLMRAGATPEDTVRLARDLLQRTLKGAESCDTSTSVCD